MALLDQVIARDPERLKPITADLVQRLQTLVGDLEVDLYGPLPDEVESAP
jgi:antitoxin PrlF